MKVTRNAALYPLHYVTYSATKFEVATSNSLGGNIYKKRDGRTDKRMDDGPNLVRNLIRPFIRGY